MKKKYSNYLNFGCGYRYHPEWTNIDMAKTGSDVIVANLLKGIPYPDNTFDFVYSSHNLEHYPKSKAQNVINDCYRVLKKDGIIRIVVPDLEQKARLYLYAIEKASSGDKNWAMNYEWIMLEMYDQTVRNQSGGDMLAYLSQDKIENLDFIIERGSTEIKGIIQYLQQNKNYISLMNKKYTFKEKIIKLILGSDFEAYKIGKFRLGGEIHQWMYDRYSLGLLLENSNFKNIKCWSATESYLSEWKSFNLDSEQDGTIYKPESLFIEAIK